MIKIETPNKFTSSASPNRTLKKASLTSSMHSPPKSIKKTIVSVPLTSTFSLNHQENSTNSNLTIKRSTSKHPTTTTTSTASIIPLPKLESNFEHPIRSIPPNEQLRFQLPQKASQPTRLRFTPAPSSTFLPSPTKPSNSAITTAPSLAFFSEGTNKLPMQQQQQQQHTNTTYHNPSRSVVLHHQCSIVKTECEDIENIEQNNNQNTQSDLNSNEDFKFHSPPQTTTTMMMQSPIKQSQQLTQLRPLLVKSASEAASITAGTNTHASGTGIIKVASIRRIPSKCNHSIFMDSSPILTSSQTSNLSPPQKFNYNINDEQTTALPTTIHNTDCPRTQYALPPITAVTKPSQQLQNPLHQGKKLNNSINNHNDNLSHDIANFESNHDDPFMLIKSTAAMTAQSTVVNNKDNTHNAQFIKGPSGLPMIKASSAKFLRVKNAIITVQRLSNYPARIINSVNDLVEDLKEYKEQAAALSPDPHQKSKTEQRERNVANTFKTAFDAIHRREKFSRLCEGGSDADIDEMKTILQNDPKRNIREPSDPEHLLSKPNSKGQTPLYIACKFGNIQVVKLLVRMGCNNTLKSKIEESVSETPLEVAMRWQYTEIVEYLLENCNFSDSYLLQCLDSQPLKKDQKLLLQSKLQMKSSACTIF